MKNKKQTPKIVKDLLTIVRKNKNIKQKDLARKMQLLGYQMNARKIRELTHNIRVNHSKGSLYWLVADNNGYDIVLRKSPRAKMWRKRIEAQINNTNKLISSYYGR